MVAPLPAEQLETDIVTDECPCRYRPHMRSTPVADIDPIAGTTLDFTDAVNVFDEDPISVPFA